jgi:hypothetical protein
MSYFFYWKKLFFFHCDKTFRFSLPVISVDCSSTGAVGTLFSFLQPNNYVFNIICQHFEIYSRNANKHYNRHLISWWSVLSVEETGIPGENHWHAASNWQTLSYNVVSGTPLLSGIRKFLKFRKFEKYIKLLKT